MARLIDTPALGYILELLAQNGVTEACLTLKYMPEAITDYIAENKFGLKLQARIEEEPLGTAGGVRACADFIGDDDFLVISGDCVCDFDLKALMAFHKSKSALATLALYEHPEPLEYGLVIARADGRIAEFIEKPPWEGVVTNSINTGIYILSPSALEYIPGGRSYDFGKELFPNLLAENRELFGIAMSGYWCDIGSPEAYRQCCIDMIEGRVKTRLRAPLVRPGVWSASLIPVGVTITPPIYIGGGVKLHPGASVGPRAVIGEGSEIADGATVRDCVINGASILGDAAVDGAVICKNAVIGRGAAVRPNAVVGEGGIVGDEAVIFDAVKIWPGKQIPANTPVKASITQSPPKGGLSFTARGVISGKLGAEITPSDCLDLGRVIGGAFARVGIGHSGEDEARVIAEAIGCGVCAAGGELLRFDSGLSSCASFVGESYNLPVTLCVASRSDGLDITFFGRDGGLFPHAQERRMLAPPDGELTSVRVGPVQDIVGVSEAYAAAAARYAGEDCSQLAVSVIGKGPQNEALKRTLELMGCVVTQDADIAFEVTGGGTRLHARGEDGSLFQPEQTLALVCATLFGHGHREIAVPFDAPKAIDDMAARCGATVLRLGRDGERAERLYTRLRSLRDGVFAAALICAQIKKEGASLNELMSRNVPRFVVVEREVTLKSARGEVMGTLSRAACEAGAEFADGIKLGAGDGSVLISPMRGKNAIRIRAEAASMEAAEELCAEFVSEGLEGKNT